MSNGLRVHCVGGPAHGEDRIVHRDVGDYFRIAVLPRARITVRPGDRPEYVECFAHIYRIICVDRDRFIALYQE